MMKLFCILALFVSTGCAVYPTSYQGYSYYPGTVVLYPSHNNHWHEFRHSHRWNDDWSR